MLSAWDDYACWKIGIRASHGLSAAQSTQSNGCGSTSTTQNSGFHLLGSVLGSCLCTVDYARIAARYRDQLRTQREHFYLMGMRSKTVSRNTLATPIESVHLNLKHSLYEILRVLDLNVFEMTPIEALLSKPLESTELSDYPVEQDLSLTFGH